jgi:hypothetical protein
MQDNKPLLICNFCHKEFSKEQNYRDHMSKKSPCCFDSELNMKLKQKQILDIEAFKIDEFTLKLDTLRILISKYGSKIDAETFNMAMNGQSMKETIHEGHTKQCRCIPRYKTEYKILVDYLFREKDMELFEQRK